MTKEQNDEVPPSPGAAGRSAEVATGNDSSARSEDQNTPALSRILRFDRIELAGAFGDLGTLLPIVVAMIFINKLSPSSVFLAFGIFYLVSGYYYRLPIVSKDIFMSGVQGPFAGYPVNLILGILVFGLVLLLLDNKRYPVPRNCLDARSTSSHLPKLYIAG